MWREGKGKEVEGKGRKWERGEEKASDGKGREGEGTGKRWMAPFSNSRICHCVIPSFRKIFITKLPISII